MVGEGWKKEANINYRIKMCVAFQICNNDKYVWFFLRIYRGTFNRVSTYKRFVGWTLSFLLSTISDRGFLYYILFSSSAKKKESNAKIIILRIKNKSPKRSSLRSQMQPSLKIIWSISIVSGKYLPLDMIGILGKCRAGKKRNLYFSRIKVVVCCFWVMYLTKQLWVVYTIQSRNEG